jgi:NAD-dependent dihydropyrimidine dehydrogenase PreA subunit
MCDFCHKHGEGKKWYLEAKNYSDDLFNELSQKAIKNLFGDIEVLRKGFKEMEKLDTMPGLLRSAFSWNFTRKMKKVHFGQIVPIEDVEQIFGMVNSIVRVACVCRYAYLGKEHRYCYGISLTPGEGAFTKALKELPNGFYIGPDTHGFETKTKDEALQELKSYEREGLCHSVWTFGTPFIAGICNCDRAECGALQSTLIYNLQMVFKGEYFAEVNWDTCNGCRNCMRVCQFGAFGYSASNKKVTVDSHRCYGCGICRSVCTKNSISLKFKGVRS